MQTKQRISMAVVMALNLSIVQAETSSSAEEDLMLLYEDEEIVEIATGTSKPIHLAPSVASVITAKDIKASGARTLDEALEQVAGLHVSLSPINRLKSIYSIRGIYTAENPQIKFLVNGLSYDVSINGGRPPLFRMPVADISRIEVIRGPGSAIYGEDAVSGVINVITKSADEINGAEVGVRAGSFNSQDIWGLYGSELSGWDIAVSLEYSGSDGDDSRIVQSDFQTSLDDAFNDPASLPRASLAPGPLNTNYDLLNTSIDISHDEWSIWFSGYHMRDAGLGAGGLQALDPAGSLDVDHYALVLGYSEADLPQDWELDSHLSYRYTSEQSYMNLLPPGTYVPIGTSGDSIGNLCLPSCDSVPNMVLFTDGFIGNPGGTQNEFKFDVITIYNGFQKHNLRLGAGLEKDDFSATETKNYGPGVIDGTVSPIDGTLTDVTGTEDIFMQDQKRFSYHLSLQDEWSFAADWELTAGVRYDHYNDFGSTVNPRVALVWATAYNLTTKFLYGSAFRAPSFGELYYKNNPVIEGNPNLKPETIDMFELVFDYRPSFDLQTILNLFAYKMEDQIEYVSGLAQNNNTQDGHGFEFEATWKLRENLDLLGNYAWQHSEDRNGNVVPYAPRQQAFAGLRWSIQPSLMFSTQLYWIGGRARAVDDPRPEIADYTLLDFVLRHREFAKPWEFAASLKNALDKDAREPSDGRIPDDYPLEGRSVFLEVIYHIR